MAASGTVVVVVKWFDQVVGSKNRDGRLVGMLERTFVSMLDWRRWRWSIGKSRRGWLWNSDRRKLLVRLLTYNVANQ